MNGEMDWKKFLLYYLPVAAVLLIVGQVCKDWVNDHAILYYILLIGWAVVSEQLARRKKEE